MTGKRTRHNRRVVVLGQVCRDLVCEVRAPPGAGSSVPIETRLELLGGKGANQAVGMAQLGLRPSLISAVGDDGVGEELRAALVRDGIDDTYVVVRKGSSSGLVVSVVAEGRWRYLEDFPEPTLARPADVTAAEPAIAGAGAIVCQLQQPLDAVRQAIVIARRHGVRVVLDGAPSSGDGERFVAQADVVRADDREVEELFGRPLRDANDALLAADELVRAGPSFVALAAGEAGNAFAWQSGHLLIPFGAEPVIDSTGAGDAMVAATVFGLALGWPGEEVARAAHRAAAATVTRLGGRPALRAGLIDDRFVDDER